MVLRTELMMRHWLSVTVFQEQTFPNSNTLDLLPTFVTQTLPLWWSGSCSYIQQSKANSIFRSLQIFGENKDYFFLSKPEPRIQRLIFRLTDYLKSFAPSSWLLAILLLISIATEGWTGNRKNQSCLLFINCLLPTTTNLLWEGICIEQLLFAHLFLSNFSICCVLSYSYMVEVSIYVSY